MTDTPQDVEQQWQVTVRVPMHLPVEQRHELFSAVVKAVGEWEPSDRDGWDADISGEPRGAACLGERMLDWADTLLRQPSGSIPVGDVAWKLRDMVRAVVPPEPQDTPDIIEQAAHIIEPEAHDLADRARRGELDRLTASMAWERVHAARRRARDLAAAGLLRTPEQQGATEYAVGHGMELYKMGSLQEATEYLLGCGPRGPQPEILSRTVTPWRPVSPTEPVVGDGGCPCGGDCSTTEPAPDKEA